MLVGAVAGAEAEIFDDRGCFCKHQLLTVMRDKSACKHYDSLPYR